MNGLRLTTIWPLHITCGPAFSTNRWDLIRNISSVWQNISVILKILIASQIFKTFLFRIAVTFHFKNFWIKHLKSYDISQTFIWQISDGSVSIQPLRSRAQRSPHRNAHGHNLGPSFTDWNSRYRMMSSNENLVLPTHFAFDSWTCDRNMLQYICKFMWYSLLGFFF